MKSGLLNPALGKKLFRKEIPYSDYEESLKKIRRVRITTASKQNYLNEQKKKSAEELQEYLMFRRRGSKVNPKKGKGSKYNSVDYGIEVLDSSDTPDTDKGNVILCAHAGNSKVSYFRELDLLKVGDVIMITYKGKTYQYEIVDIYSIKKTGTAPIRKDRTKSTITLITCIHNTDRQIVLIGNLQNSE